MAITIDEQLRNTELKRAPVDAIQHLGKTNHEINAEGFKKAMAALDFIPTDGSEVDLNEIKFGLTFDEFMEDEK